MAEQVLRLHGVSHPSPEVHQAGFPLDHPYIEQCWTGVLGPTCTLLLRRFPTLWRQALSVEVQSGEFARSLGLGDSTGRTGQLFKTLRRLERFGFVVADGPGDWDVYTEAPPLGDRHLSRAAEWTVERHHELLTDHLHQLSRAAVPGGVAHRLNRLSSSAPSSPTRTP
jgi:hypothetical protein